VNPSEISTPKLIVTDSGLGGRLTGMSDERARDPTAPVGPLLENFAIGEVARQLTWAQEPIQLFHYRDRDKVEVDMVLEQFSFPAGDLTSATCPPRRNPSPPRLRANRLKITAVRGRVRPGAAGTSPPTVSLAEHRVEFGVGPDLPDLLRAAAGDGDLRRPPQRLLA
jgi:hypothetical protein